MHPCIISFAPLQELNAIFEKIDTNQSGLIDFDEFVTGVAKFVLEKSPNGVARYGLTRDNRYNKVFASGGTAPAAGVKLVLLVDS